MHGPTLLSQNSLSAQPALMSAPVVSLLGYTSSSSSDTLSDEDEQCSDNNSASSDTSESEEDDDEDAFRDDHGHRLLSRRFNVPQPMSAPAALAAKQQRGPGQEDDDSTLIQQQRHSVDDSSCLSTLGLGLFEKTDAKTQLPTRTIQAPSTRRAGVSQGRVFSKSTKTVANLASSSSSDEDEDEDDVNCRAPYTAHATITFAGARSASNTLRSLVAMSAHRAVGEIQTSESVKGNQEEEDDSAPATPQSERSVASRRLFATLNRNKPSADTAQSRDGLVLAPPGFSARRASPNRPPSLEQLQARAAAVAAAAASAAPTPTTPATLAWGRPTPTTPTSPTQRSISCPLRDPSESRFEFGCGVTVMVTPPTPRPQPRSPIMGYVLTNSGRPCHNVSFARSRDDLELLSPPTFEIAPGKQKILEERARESLMALKAAAEAEQRRRSCQQTGDQQVIGLGWPGPRAAPANATRADHHQARALKRSMGRRRASGRSHSGTTMSVGKYVPPALRAPRGRIMTSDGTIVAPASAPLPTHGSRRPAAKSAPPGQHVRLTRGSETVDSDTDEDVVTVPFSLQRGEPLSDGSGTRSGASRHDRWRSVERMREGQDTSNKEVSAEARRAARHKLLSKLGARVTQ